MKIRMRNPARLVVGIAVVLGLMAGPAIAVPVTGLNLTDPTLGLTGPIQSTPLTPMIDAVDGVTPHGTLRTFAQQSSGGWVYTAELDPSVEGVHSFQTTFFYGPAFIEALPGFTGRAGWSWQDAVDAGSSGNGSGAFTLEDEGVGLKWEVAGFGVTNWSSETPIRFFFESTFEPGLNDFYLFDMMNASAASAAGLAPDPDARPVPEPATLLLLASGLVAGGFWTRRARRLTA